VAVTCVCAGRIAAANWSGSLNERKIAVIIQARASKRGGGSGGAETSIEQ
jgi:hypothetical protein